jgi:hypothetical protein
LSWGDPVDADDLPAGLVPSPSVRRRPSVA